MLSQLKQQLLLGEIQLPAKWSWAAGALGELKFEVRHGTTCKVSPKWEPTAGSDLNCDNPHTVRCCVHRNELLAFDGGQSNGHSGTAEMVIRQAGTVQEAGN